MKKYLLAIGVSLFISGAATQAHHSNSAYDRTRNITVAGTVKEFKWVNPHVWLYMLVPDGKGGSDVWSFEGSSVAVLARNGWSANAIKPGQKIRVIAQPNTDGSHGGGFIKVLFDDGTSLHIGTI